MLELEDFFTRRELAAYRKVKLGTMEIARAARQVACEIVEGEIADGKEFVVTEIGTFRLAMRYNSDNSTERLMHENLDAETYVMSDAGQMAEFFNRHGKGRAYVGVFKKRVMKRCGL